MGNTAIHLSGKEQAQSTCKDSFPKMCKTQVIKGSAFGSSLSMQKPVKNASTMSLGFSCPEAWLSRWVDTHKDLLIYPLPH